MTQPDSAQSDSEFHDPPAIMTLGICAGCGSIEVEPLESSGCCEDVGTFTRVDYAALCGRPLIGQGDDTYDPECVLRAGHKGSCRPEARDGD